ncbi:MAG: HD domain-containing protein [Magnetococcales bacterium]|nr:HD domain-containing protein [Magnetococcales bacterium]
MKSIFNLPITIKIIAVILVLSTANTLLLMYNSEEQIEGAIWDQVQKQALVFLMGLEREIRRLPVPLPAEKLEKIIRDPHIFHHRDNYDFSIEKIYLFDGSGRVLAHSKPGPHPDKPLDGKYGELLQTGEPMIFEELSKPGDPGGAGHPRTMDVLIPLHHDDRVIGGIEAELNLDETFAMIKKMDDQYEESTLQMLVIHGVLMAALLWWMIHHLLIRHVRQFDRITRQIGEGELKSRVGANLPQDEVGRLGGAIDHMAENIQQLIQAQEEAYLQALRSLIKALETKDAYTAGHASRVARYSVALGRHIGLADDKLELLRKGALMHDLGKIGVPDAILNKPSGLTDEEFQAMQHHPNHTAAIMKPLKRFKEFAEIAAWHHERWDGKGYPDKLGGEAIPLLARIVAIADTWDAMTGDRVYRKGMPREKALRILTEEKERGQFDPNLLQTFIDMVQNRDAQGQPIAETPPF